ncbi:MAG TPA: BadF/BadG/BcrA/BcrD ATPase family protein [Terriglobales bacterium]|nr:BadF/BadG/BcrA/BcrD ATPase family protein [Terriglobales bacterium]
MDYLIAIDGGGTKTDIALAALDGGGVARVRVGGTSLSHHSQAVVADTLAAACQQFPGSLEHYAGAAARRLSGSRGDSRAGPRANQRRAGPRANQCRAACAGFASAGLAANAAWYRRILGELMPAAAIEVTTDAALALEGATNGGDGLLVIAGTGSIVLGRRGALTARAGGDGPPDDLGSGDWIGRQAVAAGLLPPPAARSYAALVRELGPDLTQRAAPIFERAGAALAAMLRSCADQLAWPDAPAYALGSVVEHVTALRVALERNWGRPLLSPQGTALDAALRRARALLS